MSNKQIDRILEAVEFDIPCAAAKTMARELGAEVRDLRSQLATSRAAHAEAEAARDRTRQEADNFATGWRLMKDSLEAERTAHAEAEIENGRFGALLDAERRSHAAAGERVIALERSLASTQRRLEEARRALVAQRPPNRGPDCWCFQARDVRLFGHASNCDLARAALRALPTDGAAHEEDK